MDKFDVIIVGGGIAGASLGAEIAASTRTLIIEAEDHCGYHSTGRSAAFYLESYGGPEVAKLSKASRSFLESPPAGFSEHGVSGKIEILKEHKTAEVKTILKTASGFGGCNGAALFVK